MLINTKILWITYFLNACENDHIEETYSLQAILNEPYSNFDDYKDNFSVDEEYFCNNKEFCEHNTQEVSFSDNKNCLISTYVQSKKKEPAKNSNETLPLLGNSYVIILSKNTSIISNLEVIKINNSSELPENNDNIADSKKEIVNNCDCSNSKRDHVVNSNYTLIKGLKGRYNALLKNYMLEIKDSIIKFIEQKISKRHLDCYIKRLESMERAYTDFLIFNDKNIGDDFLSLSQDSELLSFLISLHLKFRKRNKFNQGNCQKFSKEFDLVFSNKMKQFLTIVPNTKTNNYSKYNFYIEMMNLYRFVDEMPELLALCGSFNDKAYFANPLVLHIINLFLRKVGNIKENKSFVMFLIYKAFKFSQKSKQNFFMVEKYDIACNKKHPYLHFFFWELSLAKRNDINKKIKLCDLVKCKDVDKMHLKIVLIIYLYTHIDFLCFYDFKGREIAIFIKFIKKVLDSKDCFACNFDEYLEITKKQLSFFKKIVL